MTQNTPHAHNHIYVVLTYILLLNSATSITCCCCNFISFFLKSEYFLDTLSALVFYFRFLRCLYNHLLNNALTICRMNLHTHTHLHSVRNILETSLKIKAFHAAPAIACVFVRKCMATPSAHSLYTNTHNCYSNDNNRLQHKQQHKQTSCVWLAPEEKSKLKMIYVAAGTERLLNKSWHTCRRT